MELRFKPRPSNFRACAKMSRTSIGRRPRGKWVESVVKTGKERGEMRERGSTPAKRKVRRGH